MVEKFVVEISRIEIFMVEKSGVEMSFKFIVPLKTTVFDQAKVRRTFAATRSRSRSKAMEICTYPTF